MLAQGSPALQYNPMVAFQQHIPAAAHMQLQQQQQAPSKIYALNPYNNTNQQQQQQQNSRSTSASSLSSVSSTSSSSSISGTSPTQSAQTIPVTTAAAYASNSLYPQYNFGYFNPQLTCTFTPTAAAAATTANSANTLQHSQQQRVQSSLANTGLKATLTTNSNTNSASALTTINTNLTPYTQLNDKCK